ncbi:hypothetical protein HDU96_007477 [Phlyctochytrium bullatum]|nr:hypothetical protein HDU96_007477 [Phlyctochytrium bullatum]
MSGQKKGRSSKSIQGHRRSINLPGDGASTSEEEIGQNLQKRLKSGTSLSTEVETEPYEPDASEFKTARMLIGSIDDEDITRSYSYRINELFGKKVNTLNPSYWAKKDPKLLGNPLTILDSFAGVMKREHVVLVVGRRDRTFMGLPWTTMELDQLQQKIQMTWSFE